MSWLPHPSIWGKKEGKKPKSPSLILHGGPGLGLDKILKDMGVDVQIDDEPYPLFYISNVVPTPFPPRKDIGLIGLKFKYGKETEKQDEEK